MEPPGVPVDAGHLQQKRLVGILFVHGVVDLLAQRPGGRQHMGLIVLLVRQKPAALVVEPDAPEEIQRGGGIAFK